MCTRGYNPFVKNIVVVRRLVARFEFIDLDEFDPQEHREFRHWEWELDAV